MNRYTKKKREQFNEFYFKKSICSVIIFDSIDNFKRDLVNKEKIKAEESSARKEQKIENGIVAEIEVYNFGAANWKELYNKAVSKKILNIIDLNILKTATYIDEINKKCHLQLKLKEHLRYVMN